MMMRTIASTLILLFLGTASLAADTKKLVLRAYLHDPVKPRGAEFKVEGGDPQPLPLRTGALSSAVEVPVTDGELRLQLADGKRAALAKVPGEWTNAIAIILPDTAKDAALPYRVLMLEDSAKAFPWGSSQAVNLLPIDGAIQAGEHKLILQSGKVTRVPAVRQVNEFNIAQTNFNYQQGERWVPFTERQLQYLDEMRRVFLIYATPGSQRPFVTTLVDHKPVELSEKN
jgi:hypothetical protein